MGVFFLLYLNLRVKPEGIPREYVALYRELEVKLTGFEKQLAAQSDQEEYPTIFAAEFLAANGNHGRGLLNEEKYPYILKYLDALQSLGIKGVKISLNYPLLVSDFPDSEKYLKFYQQLSQEIRVARGLKLLVQATAMFTQAEFADTSLPTRQYYQGLTLEKYQEGKREHLQKIIEFVQPDYLTIETEPDTMAYLTGVDELNTPRGFAEIIRSELASLSEHPQTLIGAGVGSWSKREFIEELAAIPQLDYLETRIYPITDNFLQNAMDYLDLAKAKGKKTIIGEAWLYKAGENELHVEVGGQAAAWAEFFRRDVYSFWQPLDQKFLEILVKIAHEQKVEFVSPFWSNYFFAYLDYGWTTRNRSATELLKLSRRQAVKNTWEPKLTQTGLKYQELIKTLQESPPPPAAK